MIENYITEKKFFLTVNFHPDLFSYNFKSKNDNFIDDFQNHRFKINNLTMRVNNTMIHPSGIFMYCEITKAI